MAGKPAGKICVIGAGVAGLAAARQLKARGIDFDCFDVRPRPGGIWAYETGPGRTCAWETMNLNSPRGWYEFDDFPMPADYPDFPRRDQVAAYIELAIDHFDLRRHLRLGEAVTEVKPDGTLWRVRTATGEHEYGAVVIANGHHNEPLQPDFPGTFNGPTMHSRDYRYREPFRGKRVLVVGIGNSGNQIAVDVSAAADQTFLSARRGVWILPHYIRGVRVDRAFPAWLNFLVAFCLPNAVAGPVRSMYYRLLLGSPARNGLARPDHHYASALPTISESLYNRLGDGRIHAKPNVRRLDGDGVVFADGSRERIDEIVYCTGYRTTFPFLDPSIFATEGNRAPLYFRAFHPDRPGLYFIGLLQAVGWGFLPLFEQQARLVASHLAGTYALPSRDEMRKAIDAEMATVRSSYVNSMRGHYLTNAPLFTHACRRELARGAAR